MVKPTSKSAYNEQARSGKVVSQRQRILNWLHGQGVPRNRRQISLKLNIPINAVCGRVNALLENGDIVVACEDIDPQTGKRVEYLEPVRIVRKFEQKRMF